MDLGTLEGSNWSAIAKEAMVFASNLSVLARVPLDLAKWYILVAWAVWEWILWLANCNNNILSHPPVASHVTKGLSNLERCDLMNLSIEILLLQMVMNWELSDMKKSNLSLEISTPT